MPRLQVRAWLLLVASSTACGTDPMTPQGTGSIALDLELPPMGDLRPDGTTTVAVGVTTMDGVENITTTPLVGMSFTAGDVLVGDPVMISVELHDNTNRLCGFGRLDTPITPDASNQSVKIDVRKPFVYVSSTGPIQTIDTSVDVLDLKYQGALAAAGTIAIPIDGKDMAVINGATLQRVATTDHKLTGSPIDLGATVLDAAAVPGKRQIVAATATALILVDIEAGTKTSLPLTAKPDRIAIGGDRDTGFVAYVLSGRVAPPQGATGTCSGMSTVTQVPLTVGSEGTKTVSSTSPLADIAAAGGAIFGANPCAGSISRLDAGAPKLQVMLAGASSLAVEGVRLWAVGSSPTAAGAQLVLASVQLDGTDPRTVKLAPKTEVMTYNGDPQHELAIDMHADTEVAIDLAVLPGAQSVALIARMDTHRNARGDSFGEVIPAMTAIVHDLVIADTKTGALRRIRDNCSLAVVSNNAEFPDWSCGVLTDDEAPAAGQKTPTSVSALYGGR